MNRLTSISLWLIAALLSACLAACSSDAPYDMVDNEIQKEAPEGGYEVKLRLSFSNMGSTRANPTGGEDGDGREDGVRHENEINNVCVFIFRSIDGFNAGAATTFLFKGYFEKDMDGCDWTTIADGVQVVFKAAGYNSPKDNDRVIIIANTGNITGGINTLGALRDFQEYTSFWSKSDIRDDDHFVMSSAYNNGSDGFIHVSTHDGTHSDPFLADTRIQRAAARIDFMYNYVDNNDGGANNELIYNVKDAMSNVISMVHVQNIIPVNLMQQPSYLLKRVTTDRDITSALLYGALETKDGAGIPNQYVIEPHTLLKEAAVADATLNSWYGTTRAKTVSDNINTYLTAATGINGYMATNATVSETVAGYTFDRNMTLAYTNENTQSKEHNDPNFMTGLLLKAIYEPMTVYSDASLTVASYTKGTDFWRYSPTTISMSEENSKYFTTQAAAEAYKTAHPSEMGEVEHYPGGVCYYNIWLRHANIDTDPHLTFPMEYGIVRNNIYRVGVEKVTGPGTALPVMNGPEHIYLRIFVRKWNLRVQPAIRL